jgi:Diguanylate cyclase, GGDEF domain
MPGRTGEEALFIAQAIASALARRTLRMRGTGEALSSVRLSAGVGAWRRPDNAGTLLRRAEAVLYRAKRAGRNRVALADLSLRSVGNGLKLQPEFRTLRRAPWRRVPTRAPASVGTGYRLRFV